MKKYEITVHQSIIRVRSLVVTADSREDARDQWHALDNDDMTVEYEKILDSDWEINEVEDD